MKKRIFSVIFAIFLIFAINNYCKAATASIQCNNTAEINKTITISVSGSAVQWNLYLKVNGQLIASNSELDNVNGNKTISFSGNYTPQSEGNLTVTLEGSITEASNGSTIKSFGTRNISVTKSSSNSNSTSSSQNNSGTNNATTTTKSSNANVKMITTSPIDFSGFKASKTSGYAVTVENNVDKINVNVSKEDSKASVSLLNKTNSDKGKSWVYLAEGNNEINVTVTSEDGKNQKTYTINVTRKAKDEKTNESEKTDEKENTEETNENTETEPKEETFGLSELKLEGLELSPEFKTDIYEYNVDLKEDLEKLNITALATKENSNIEITGNENLKEGENIITIIVKGENDAETVAYQVIVNKIVEKQEDTSNQTNQNKMKKIIILSVAGGIIVIIIVAVILKNKKSKGLNGGYIPYENLNDEYDEENDNQIVEDTEDDEFYEEKTKKKKHSKGKRFK